MDEHCTVYFSQSAWLFTETDLLAILHQSRHWNTIAGISGILLYVQGRIVQVLEGEAQAVETLYKRIQLDPRHRDVTRVIDSLITDRLFADWTMGYKAMTSQQMSDMQEIMNFGRDQDEIEPAKQPATLQTIKAFYEGNSYN